jgi:hypothetical protein
LNIQLTEAQTKAITENIAIAWFNAGTNRMNATTAADHVANEMYKIKLICNPTRTDEETQYNINQPSSLVAYLGITANGKVTKTNSQQMREYNATPIIAYYDIFKNYYANKQEENFYIMNYENQITYVTAFFTCV